MIKLKPSDPEVGGPRCPSCGKPSDPWGYDIQIDEAYCFPLFSPEPMTEAEIANVRDNWPAACWAHYKARRGLWP